MRNRRCLESRADNVARSETQFGKWWMKAELLVLIWCCNYALGKLKLCNVELKEQQRVVVEHIYNGNDVCSWLPTGYGKSLCYQHTPYRVDCKLEKCGEEDCGYVVIFAIVSPRVLLMIEQVKDYANAKFHLTLGLDLGLHHY